MRRAEVSLVALALLVAAQLAGAIPASAHPLGNFSINRYAALSVGADRVDIRYILDMAEIPTFQELQDSGITPEVNHPTVGPYLARRAVGLGERLSLSIDGRRVPLDVVGTGVIFPPGAGGLPTLKISVAYRARLDAGPGPVSLHFEDDTFPGRAGWREIVAAGSADVRIVKTTVPAADRSRGLSDYPTDLLNSPPQDVEARLVFSHVPGAPVAGTTAPPVQSPPRVAAVVTPRPAEVVEHTDLGTARPANPDPVPVTLAPNRQAGRDGFAELVTSAEGGLDLVLLALIVAAGLGAFHALEPGHGKTVVAAYLVGARGTAAHAVLLGGIVTASHTLGVYLLGAVTLYASRYVLPERLYPWLGMLSGVVIAGLGLALFARRFAGAGAGHGYAHTPGGSDPHGHRHDHLHDHAHEPAPATVHAHELEYDPGHAHGHAVGHVHGRAHVHGHGDHHHVPQGERASLGQVFALGITGGIIPCPAALVVLLSALSLGRVGFGLLLIAAFSLGLAAVLIAIGLLMVYARRLMARFEGDGPIFTRWLPLTSAAVMAVVGLVIAVQALLTAGIL